MTQKHSLNATGSLKKENEGQHTSHKEKSLESKGNSLKSHSLYIRLKAVPWAAPRLSKEGVYDIRAKDKQWLRWLVKEQWSRAPLTCPVEVHFKFGFVTKRLYPFHTKKPDVDNLVKLSLDALKKIVVMDDNQVFKISAEKYYAEDDHIRIEIVEHICP